MAQPESPFFAQEEAPEVTPSEEGPQSLDEAALQLWESEGGPFVDQDDSPAES